MLAHYISTYRIPVIAEGLHTKQLILDRPFISRTKILHTQFLDRGSGIIHDYEIRFTVLRRKLPIRSSNDNTVQSLAYIYR